MTGSCGCPFARGFELDLAHATDHVLLDTLVHCTANGSLTSYAYGFKVGGYKDVLQPRPSQDS